MEWREVKELKGWKGWKGKEEERSGCEEVGRGMRGERDERLSGENQSGRRSNHSIRQTDCVYGILFLPIPNDTQFIQCVTRNF